MSNHSKVPVSIARARHAKQVPEHLLSFDCWTGMRGRLLGYFEPLIPDLSHPDLDGPMVGTCPICQRPGFELDDLWGMWHCKSCQRAGNAWSLEAYLSPREDWGACAARADRMMAEAWAEGAELEEAA